MINRLSYMVCFALTCHAIKIGVVYDGSITDQIAKDVVYKAVLMNPELSSSAASKHDAFDLQLLWRQLKVTNALFALEEVCSLVDEGIQGLVSVLPCRSRQYVFSQVDVFNLPHVAINTEACEPPIYGSFSIQLNSQHSVQNALVRDVMDREGWKSAGVVFDENVDSVQRKSLVLSLSAAMIESSIAIAESCCLGINATSPLSRLKRAETEGIVLVAKSKSLDAILAKANMLGLLDTKYYWIMIVDDLLPSDAPTIFRHYSKSNILLVRRVWSGSRRCSDIHCGLPNCLHEKTCHEFCPYMSLAEARLVDAISIISVVGTKVSAEARRNMSNSCLQNNPEKIPGGKTLMTDMKATNIKGFTTLHGFNNEGYPRQVSYELYSVNNSSHEPLVLVGTWDSQSGLATEDVEGLFLNKFYDFGDRVLTIATLESHPFCFRVPRDDNVTEFKGFAFDILNELASRLKFSYRIVEPPDRLYGAPNPDGSWNGMVGMVKRGEIDMAVGPFTITSIRESVIDFTKPYLEDSTGILTRKPQDEDSQLFQMFKPYSGEVWGAIAAATLFVGIISFLVNYYTPYSAIRQGLEEATLDEISFTENLWLIYSSAMEQEHESMSGKIFNCQNKTVALFETNIYFGIYQNNNEQAWIELSLTLDLMWECRMSTVILFLYNVLWRIIFPEFRGSVLLRLLQIAVSLQKHTRRGATYHPNATSGRLVLGFFWIFTIVVVATYTANLAAFLTVSVPYTPINSLGELLAQSEVQPVVKDGTNLWAMFQRSKKGIYEEVWKRLQSSPRATVTEDALELVETGQYAYMSDTALLRYIALKGCTFAVANEVFNTAGYGFVMPENAPFEDAVNYNIMKMQEAGLIEKWRQKWWSADGTTCSGEDRTGSATSLSLSNLGGAFLVYIIVAGVAIVCLGLEILGKTTGIMKKIRRGLKQPVEDKLNGYHQNGVR